MDLPVIDLCFQATIFVGQGNTNRYLDSHGHNRKPTGCWPEVKPPPGKSTSGWSQRPPHHLGPLSAAILRVRVILNKAQPERQKRIGRFGIHYNSPQIFTRTLVARADANLIDDEDPIEMV
ncbi:hypothetical protein L1987_87070 [Smallanthus sonchifolius]|nr:hypothetical protein L1987_87070 [Smallanthus sonchifolius]